MNISAINNYNMSVSKNQNFTGSMPLLSPGEFAKVKTQHTHDIVRAMDTDYNEYWYCMKPGEQDFRVKAKISQFEKENSLFHSDGYWKDKIISRVTKVVDVDGNAQHINIRA